MYDELVKNKYKYFVLVIGLFHNEWRQLLLSEREWPSQGETNSDREQASSRSRSDQSPIEISWVQWSLVSSNNPHHFPYSNASSSADHSRREFSIQGFVDHPVARQQSGGPYLAN